MKRRQFKHKMKTLTEVLIKRRKRDRNWRFTDLDTFTYVKDLSWSELCRLQKKQKPVTDRGIKFRSSNRLYQCDIQNSVQWILKMDSELLEWEGKIDEETSV